MDGLAYVGLALLAALVIGTWLYARFTQPSSDQVALLLEREGGRVDSDRELITALTGDLDVSSPMMLAAYCANGWYWATDETLNTRIVVATDHRLIRAAELVAAGSFEEGLVEAVESARLTIGSDTQLDIGQLPDKLVAGAGEDTVQRYLDEAEIDPSESSSQRFVAYAVSRTLRDQRVYVIDLESLDRAAIDRFVNEPGFGTRGDDVVVAGATSPIPIQDSQCRQLTN